MSEIRGTLLAAPVTTGNTDAKFGTHYSFLGIGGYQEFQTLAERDGIPVDEIYARLNDDGRSSGRRRFNMLVFIWESRQFYQLFIPDWNILVTDEEKYNALMNNQYWIAPLFYIPPPPAPNIIKLPANTLWASPDHTAETFFFDTEYDFNGRFIDNVFLLDTAGMIPAVDPTKDHNMTSNLYIKIIDSTLGGFVGFGMLRKRVNGSLFVLEPGEIKANQHYLLMPPMDRTMQGEYFLNPFELVKCEWYTQPPVTGPVENVLRIPGNVLSGNFDGTSEMFFAFGEFSFGDRLRDNIFLLDTAGLTTNLDGNATSNVTSNVEIRVLDASLGSLQVVGTIQKRVNNVLVNLEPGDLKRDCIYFLIPPSDRSYSGMGVFNYPFELIKWDWFAPVNDTNYVVDLPIGDSGFTQYIYGSEHQMNKIPSVTILDAVNKVVTNDAVITIDPVSFDVTMVFMTIPTGKAVLN